MYTVVIIVDILSEQGATLISEVSMLLEQQYPIRFGFIFDCSVKDNNENNDSNSSITITNI
jgi:hypothetical protein